MPRPAPMIAACALWLCPAPAQAGPDDWAEASDIGRDVLLVASLGVPLAQGDWEGGLQAGGSLLATKASTWILKESISERRPDGSDNRSFPSGHTSMSFAAAMSLERRYGWKVGLPSLALATFVGASRVAADKHHVHDVIAGAVLGGGVAYLLTTPRSDRVRLVPWAGNGGGGVLVAVRW